MSTKRTSSLIPLRLGGLLISAGFIRPDHMAAALSQARQFNLKVGDLLVAAHLITDADLQCALEIQQLIKNGTIPVETGTLALKETRQQNCGVSSALAKFGYKQEAAIQTTDLTSILLDAGVITKEQVEQASWNAAKNQLTLGRNLVLAGALSPSVLVSALNALVLLRAQTVTRQEAIQALALSNKEKIPIEDILVDAARISPNHVRFGELLTSANLLSESDAMIAVENGLLSQKPVGQVMLSTNMVSPLVLEACVKLQIMILSGSVSKVQAFELLRQVATQRVGLETCLAEMSYLKSRVLELLVGSGLVTEAHVQMVLGYNPELESDLIKGLLAHEVITQDMFRSGVRCVYAINDGSRTIDEMVLWLRGEYLKFSAVSA